MAKHNEIGALGEKIACQFLKNKRMKVIETNYWKPYGEIDIVARENKTTHFIEVKSVSYLPAGRQVKGEPTVPYGTIRPEENLHPGKMKKLSRVIESYIISHETDEWTFDLICVYIDQKNRKAQVKWLKDITLEG